MKLLITCALSITLLAACQMQKPPEGKSFTFENAILKDELSGIIIACGTVSTADALLFQSNNSDSCIVGIIQCVSLYGREFFKKGDHYKLNVTQDSLAERFRDWHVQNNYGNKYPVYLVTHISKTE